MCGLLDHEPISETDRNTILRFCRESARAGLYHFDAAKRLVEWLEASDFEVLGDFDLDDGELTFKGPADSDVDAAWRERLERMPRLCAAAGSGFVDRLAHRCHILETGNDSFRFKASSAKAARTKKETSHVLTED